MSRNYAKENVMKILVTLLVAALMLCGCTSLRYSGKYGNGTKYAGIGNTRTFRKFYLRKIEGDGAFVSSVFLNQKYPALFSRQQGRDDVPIDVYARKTSSDDGGGWSFVFAFLYSIIPSWTWMEDTYSVEISVDGNEKLVPATTCIYNHDFKMSIFSPLGLIPYPDKNGYQRNEHKSGIMATSLNIADVLTDVMGDCIAQQVTEHALDMLTVPDIDFTAEEKENAK